jgi:tyrosyl-tRNA synthetase
MADVEDNKVGEIVGAETEEDAGKESMHLTKDKLKNPILDYIQHIVLSPPGSSFTCGTATSPDGQVFTKYEEVKASFLNGDITPDQLKKGLISSLNELLQPVRDHFTNNENAKRLLDLVREFKKTTAPNVKDAAPKVVRLDLVSKGMVPADCHLVMTSLPNSNPTLQSAADLLAKLAAAPDQKAPKVLMLMDWTARVNSALDADPKMISAYYAVMLTSLRALDKQLNGEENSLMKDVTVLLQSDAILKDPSSYWISVINAGRYFPLDTVMGANIGLGEGMKDSEQVGVVIGRLMMVADVLAVNPKSIAFDAVVDEMGPALTGLNLEDSNSTPSALSVEGYLIQEYYKEKLSHHAIVSQFQAPTIVQDYNVPNLQLQPSRESAALKTDFDEYFLLDDPKVNAKSKTKKSFCEPGNIDFCPPIELLAYFGGLDSGKEVTIQRSPDNGGNVIYKSKADLQNDFESGSLHPGDLKGVVSTVMLELLTCISEELKNDDEATKSAKVLRSFEKKMAKQKKK